VISVREFAARKNHIEDAIDGDAIRSRLAAGIGISTSWHRHDTRAEEFVFADSAGATNGLPHFMRKAAGGKARTTNGLPYLSWTNMTRTPLMTARYSTLPESGVGRRYVFDSAELLQMYGQLIGRKPIPPPPEFSRLWFHLKGTGFDAPEAFTRLKR